MSDKEQLKLHVKYISYQNRVSWKLSIFCIGNDSIRSEYNLSANFLSDNTKMDCSVLSLVSVTMTTNTVLPLSVLLLTAGCVCNSLQPTNLSACPQQSSFPFEPDNCLSLHPSYFKFSLTSHRNQTGHWVAQVNFQLSHGVTSK
jgi:hypothetical protein